MCNVFFFVVGQMPKSFEIITILIPTKKRLIAMRKVFCASILFPKLCLFVTHSSNIIKNVPKKQTQIMRTEMRRSQGNVKVFSNDLCQNGVLNTLNSRYFKRAFN